MAGSDPFSSLLSMPSQRAAANVPLNQLRKPAGGAAGGAPASRPGSAQPPAQQQLLQQAWDFDLLLQKPASPAPPAVSPQQQQQQQQQLHHARSPAEQRNTATPPAGLVDRARSTDSLARPASVSSLPRQASRAADLDLFGDDLPSKLSSTPAPTQRQPSAATDGLLISTADADAGDIFDVGFLASRPVVVQEPPAPAPAPPKQQEQQRPLTAERKSPAAPQQAEPSPQLRRSASSPLRNGTPAAADASGPSDKDVAMLVSMGYTAEKAYAALDAAGTIPGAIELLVSESAAARARDEYRVQHLHASYAHASPHEQQLQLVQEKVVQTATEIYSKASSLFNVGKKRVVEMIEKQQQQRRGNAGSYDTDAYYNGSGSSFDRYSDNSYRDDDRREEYSRRPQQPEKMTREPESPSPLSSSINGGAPPPKPARIPQPAAAPLVQEVDLLSLDGPPKPSSSGSNINLQGSMSASTASAIKAQNVAPARVATPPQQSQPRQPQQQRQYTDTQQQQLQSRQQPQKKPEATPQPPPKKPAVVATPQQLALCESEKAQGNTFYKQGNYPDSVTHYTRAIDALPAGHELLAVLHNNRAMSHLKASEYARCISDCTVVAGLDPRDVKCLLRRGAACEALEKWQDALADYRAAMGIDSSAKLAQDGVTRCQKMMSAKGAPCSSLKQPAASLKKSSEQLNSSSSASASNNDPRLKREIEQAQRVAVNELKKQYEKQETEERQKLEMKDSVDQRINQWRNKKEDNIRALLSTVHVLLPSVRRVGLNEVVQAKDVKRAYMRVIAQVHPDKMSGGASVEERVLAAAAFSTLNEAYEAFRAKEGV